MPWIAALSALPALGCRQVFPDPAAGQGPGDFVPLALLCLAAAGFGWWARRRL